MDAKKISFGFSKIIKKPNLLPTKECAKTETKVELIKCLEGQEIKLVKEKQEVEPLIIPLKESRKTSAAIASLIKRRAVLLDEEEPEVDNHSADPSISIHSEGPEENIEKRAARELLAENKNNSSSTSANTLVLPVIKPEDLPLEGAKEPTLDDYESIPIQDFGKAMLRGMGWTEPSSNTNKKDDQPIDSTPMVRPKGMGLGADKALKKKTLLVAPEVNEVLEVKRNAYVLILGGKHKDLYGQIEGFDDHAGRVIVKMAIGGTKEVFNEFLCQPVSKKEYAQYGKCINTSKYEEYKSYQNKYGQIIMDKKIRDLIDKKEKNIKKEQHYSVEEKYHTKTSVYAEHRKKENYKEDTKDFKRGDKYEEQRSKYCIKEFKEKSRGAIRDEYRDRRNEAKSDHRSQDDGMEKNEYPGNDGSYRQQEYDRYALKSDYPSSQDCKKDEQQDRKTYAERNYQSQYKAINLDESSNSERDPYSSGPKKFIRDNLKNKSKKSKKSKSKYKSNSSDTDTSSSMDIPSHSKTKKHKKHIKKKTSKSKNKRERSCSRGNRK